MRSMWNAITSWAGVEKRFDVAVLTDIRFQGGTGSSTSQEIRIQNDAGLTTALFHVPSTILGLTPLESIPRKLRKPAPKIAASLSKGYSSLRRSDERIYAPLTIMRHPTIANSTRFLPRGLKTDEIILVVNHPAVGPNGTTDYALDNVIRNIESVFGIRPKVCPNSPVAAQNCVAPGSEPVGIHFYWSNIFDIPSHAPRRRNAHEPIVLGRHSRDNAEKWPGDADIIRQAYPSADGIKVRVMGGASTPKNVLSELPANWEILPFDPFGAASFLQSIDVYVYFHHPAWVEAFGRAPCEAMMAGIPTILPKYLEANFGEAAIYCEPHEVLSIVRKLQADPDEYNRTSIRTRELAASKFGAFHHLNRLRRSDQIAKKLDRARPASAL